MTQERFPRFSRLLGQLWLGIGCVWVLTARLLYTPNHDLVHTLERGHDAFGRPLFWLIPWGAGQSLGMSALILSGTVLLALAVQAALFWMPRLASLAVQTLIDLLLAVPSLLLALVCAAIYGPSHTTLALALLLSLLPSSVRMLTLRANEVARAGYVTSSRAMGSEKFALWRRHILPELLSLMRIKIPGLLSVSVLAEATLSFLGVGAPVGDVTWGVLLAQGREYLLEAPWIALWTGLPLFLTLVCLHIAFRATR